MRRVERRKSMSPRHMVLTSAASIIIIIIGLFYFIATLWIVKFGASLLNIELDGNWAVMAAAIISAGSMIGSGMQK